MNKAAIKIVLTLIYTIVLFFVKDLLHYTYFLGFTIILYINLNIPIYKFLSLVKKILPLLLLTVVINMFYTSVEFASIMIIRVFCLILMNFILVNTTTSLELTYGIEALLSPLKIFKFPVSAFAMMMIIALRFIPILEEETRTLMLAHKAKGVDFGSKNIFEKVRFLNSLMIPLFVSILNRAEQIAVALESKGYTA